MKLKKSIHRMLIVRLAVAATIIAALIALAAVFAALNEIDETAVERAFTAAAQFKGYIVDQLDAPGLGDHAKIRQALDGAFLRLLLIWSRATSYLPAYWIRTSTR
jgi:hypothetical protein